MYNCAATNEKGTPCQLPDHHEPPCDFRLGGPQRHTWKTVERCDTYAAAAGALAQLDTPASTKIRAMADGSFKAQVGRKLAVEKTD